LKISTFTNDVLTNIEKIESERAGEEFQKEYQLPQKDRFEFTTQKELINAENNEELTQIWI